MIIVLNNKCNLNKEEYLKYIEEINAIDSQSKLVLCPTFLNINITPPTNVSLGAQNVSAKSQGAYTGEVSANQLKSFNVEFCLVGHSERRIYQKETNKEINSKIKRLLDKNITPILCVGETKEQKEKNQVNEIIRQEIIMAIEDLTESEKNKIIIAYEPIWSIGTNKIPKSQEIENILKQIKLLLPNSQILYGGSVNEKNVDTLKKINLIDGYLLGGLSLKTNDLKIFLKKIEN